MRRSLICLGLVSSAVLSTPGFAQYASDIFRYSEINQTGSARFQSLGGNHAAIGGDASSISGNPAGLGFYNRSEFSVSPGFANINTQSTYIGQTTTAGKSNGNLAQASLVITSQPSFQRKWKRTSFGVSFSRQQSFQNHFEYNGVNNRSAFVDKVREDADALGWTNKQYDDEYNSNGNLYYYLDEAYFGLQMIYPTTYNPSNGTYSRPYARDDQGKPTQQNGVFDSKGATTQWSISYGGNYNDKLYMGGSIGFSGIRYDYQHTLQDTYVGGTVFRGSVLNENFTVRGNGVNLTYGVIYKFAPTFQLGGSITSPTWSRVTKENFDQNINADYIPGTIRDDQGRDIGPTETNVSLVTNEFQYRFSSPFRGAAGATYFFGSKGFLTGTVEFVGYGGMRGSSSYSDASANADFKRNTNAEIKDLYRNAVNARLGGEFRAGAFRGRLGFAYLSDPYRIQTDGIDRSKLSFNAGVGFRSDRFFADLSAGLTSFKSAFTPYVMNSASDYSSASIKNNVVNVVVSVGTFF